MNTPDFSRLKAIFLTTRNAKEQEESIKKLTKICAELDIKILLENHSAKALNLNCGQSLDEIFSQTNLVISLGGDGNYIGACRRFAKKNAYIFGVHTGKLGFLTDVLLDDCKNFIIDIKNGNFATQSQHLLQAKFLGEKTQFKFAFNDITLMRKNINTTAHIDAFLDDLHFNSYFGDGVIVSSAMGSTAYNLSAGGAIIHPSAKVFSLTPICSHSLTQRPLILPDNFCIKFTSKDDVVVLIDGQDHLDLKNFSLVEISLSEQKVHLLHKIQRNYFSVLKEKLHWGHR